MQSVLVKKMKEKEGETNNTTASESVGTSSSTNSTSSQKINDMIQTVQKEASLVARLVVEADERISSLLVVNTGSRHQTQRRTQSLQNSREQTAKAHDGSFRRRNARTFRIRSRVQRSFELFANGESFARIQDSILRRKHREIPSDVCFHIFERRRKRRGRGRRPRKRKRS